MSAHGQKNDFPLVAGVTETAQSDPGLRLASLMAGTLPQTNRDRIASTIAELEEVFSDEQDEGTRMRVGAAIAMLRRGNQKKKERE